MQVSRLSPIPVAALLVAASAPSRAEPVRAVIEMYTSQGCASCPAADRMAGEWSRRPGLLVLTLPVTYWDYLGWKDNLATRAFTERQRGYASGRSERSLFTPQAVINGKDALVGSDRTGIERCVGEAEALGGLPVGMRIEERDERIVVDVDADPSGRHADVWLVPVSRSRPVAIERGENKGRVVIYANVVRGMQNLGAWTGRAARFEIAREAARRTGADGYVAMLQGASNGQPARVLGAAKGPGL